MAERYQRQAREDRPAAAYLNSYPVQANPYAAMESVAPEIQKYALQLQRRQEEHDTASVMNAGVEYDRRMTEMLAEMTKNRLLGDAYGMTEDVDRRGDEVAQDIAGRLQNKAQRTAFLRMAGQKKLGYWRQGSEHEARQGRAYLEQSTQAALANAKSRALGGGSLEESHREIEHILSAYMLGASPEALERAVAAAQSDVSAAWLTQAAQEDPVGALVLLEDEGLRLLPETRAGLKEQIGPKAEIWEVQGLAQDLFDRHGPMGEVEALKEARRRWGGEKANRVASMVRTLYQEADIHADSQRAVLRRAQDDFFDTLEQERLIDKRMRTRAEMEALWRSGRIREDQFDRYENGRTLKATQAGILKRLGDTPAYRDAAPDRQFEMRAAELGYTKAWQNGMMRDLVRGLSNGSLKEAAIDDYVDRWIMPESEAERVRQWFKTTPKEKKLYSDFYRDDPVNGLTAQLDFIFGGEKAAPAAAVSAAQTAYDSAILNIPGDVGDYPGAVSKAVTAALLAGVQASGAEETEISAWSGRRLPTDIYTRLRQAQRGAENEAQRRREGLFVPRMYEPQERDLPSEAQAAASPSVNVGQAMLGNAAARVTSPFNAKRTDHKDGIHGALDLGVPEGTAVKAPPQLGPMSVQAAGWDSKGGGGYYVKLGGRVRDASYTITLCHLQKDSIAVEKGASVEAGQLLAKSGNTGRSSGPHLHVKTTINGKAVDPEKFYSLLGVGTDAQEGTPPGAAPAAAQKPTLHGILFENN